LYYYLPILTLAICDLCAAIIGYRYPLKKINIYIETKSMGGFLAFFLSFILLNLTLIQFNYQIPLVFIIVAGLFSAFVELISPRGIDNITIPLSVIMTMNYLL
jgi:dolichol kinase